MMKSEPGAYRATMLYILNPASIYFSSVYNESYYALFSLAGMYLCESAEKSYRRIVWAALCFALAGCCRSNAVALLAFAGWATLRLMFTQPSFIKTLKGVLTGLFSVLLVGATFYVLSLYAGYELYCRHPAADAAVPSWCAAKLPNMYTHIQAKYWYQT